MGCHYNTGKSCFRDSNVYIQNTQLFPALTQAEFVSSSFSPFSHTSHFVGSLSQLLQPTTVHAGEETERVCVATGVSLELLTALSISKFVV